MTKTLRLYAYIGVGVALIAASTAIYFSIRKGVFDEIDTQNTKAVSTADKASLGLRDCLDSGRMWIFETGKCGGVAGSNGG